MKNNPRANQSDKNANEDNGEHLTEKQKRVAALKASLLAPQSAPKKKAVGPSSDSDPMGDKHKRVMDWGTPRLVTKNRQLVMDPKQMEQRNFLLGMANARKGVTELKSEGPKAEFA